MDKYYRLMRGFNWWPDEQPSDEIKEACWHKMEECGFVVDTVLSHTCPYKYIPREAFLPMINQDSVDDSTEKWLDNIESRLYYERWYTGTSANGSTNSTSCSTTSKLQRNDNE